MKTIGEKLDDLLDKDTREYLDQPEDDVCPDCLLPNNFCVCSNEED